MDSKERKERSNKTNAAFALEFEKYKNAANAFLETVRRYSGEMNGYLEDSTAQEEQYKYDRGTYADMEKKQQNLAVENMQLRKKVDELTKNATADGLLKSLAEPLAKLFELAAGDGSGKVAGVAGAIAQAIEKRGYSIICHKQGDNVEKDQSKGRVEVHGDLVDVTSDKSKKGLVSSCNRLGFEKNGEVVLPEEVVIYKYSEGAQLRNEEPVSEYVPGTDYGIVASLDRMQAGIQLLSDKICDLLVDRQGRPGFSKNRSFEFNRKCTPQYIHFHDNIPVSSFAFILQQNGAIYFECYNQQGMAARVLVAPPKA